MSTCFESDKTFWFEMVCICYCLLVMPRLHVHTGAWQWMLVRFFVHLFRHVVGQILAGHILKHIFLFENDHADTKTADYCFFANSQLSLSINIMSLYHVIGIVFCFTSRLLNTLLFEWDITWVSNSLDPALTPWYSSKLCTRSHLVIKRFRGLKEWMTFDANYSREPAIIIQYWIWQLCGTYDGLNCDGLSINLQGYISGIFLLTILYTRSVK